MTWRGVKEAVDRLNDPPGPRSWEKFRVQTAEVLRSTESGDRAGVAVREVVTSSGVPENVAQLIPGSSSLA